MPEGLGLLLLFLVVIILLGTLAYGAVSAAPWVPLGRRDAERLLHLVQLKPGELVYDLGCGDGRLLIAAAKQYQARGVGFEIAVLPYIAAKLLVYLTGTRKLVSIRLRNFWREPLINADAVICFLTPNALKKLESRIPNELKSNARFVSYAFKLKSVPPSFVSKPTATSTPIYLYTKSVQ